MRVFVLGNEEKLTLSAHPLVMKALANKTTRYLVDCIKLNMRPSKGTSYLTAARRWPSLCFLTRAQQADESLGDSLCETTRNVYKNVEDFCRVNKSDNLSKNFEEAHLSKVAPGRLTPVSYPVDNFCNESFSFTDFPKLVQDEFFV